MKKVVMFAFVLGALAMAGQVWAGGSCCPMGGKKAQEASCSKSCSAALSGIDLTAEQRDKVAAIEAECKAQGSSKEACKASMSKIRDVLTAEQQAAFDAACSKTESKGGCGG